MTKIFLALLCCATLSAQTKFSDGPAYPALVYASLPAAASSDGKHFRVTDCLTSACTAGGGSTKMDVASNGSAWVTIGSGSGSGDMLGANNLSDVASAATSRTNLGLVPGTNVQAFDATLLSIALLGTAADRISYTTAVDTWAETPLTAFGRSLIDDAAASNARTTLGLVIGTDVLAPNGSAASLTSFPTFNQSTSGNAATATALDANPTDCSAGQYTTTIAASGNLTCAVVTDAQLSVSDITTNNASTSNHGFLKKLDNDSTHFINGQGNWAVPPGSDVSTTAGATFGAFPYDFTAATVALAAVHARTDTVQSWTAGATQTFTPSASLFGVKVGCGNLPSTVASAGGIACNSSGIFGVNDGTDTNAIVTFAGSGAAYSAAPAAGLLMSWAAGYKAVALGQSTPASASATCTTNQVTFDTGFIYICTATNTWKRAAVATW